MRFRNLRNWDDVNGSASLVYFAQLIEELLFDYTLDAYKPSAMNTVLLINEASETIANIASGVIMKPNLQHVLDELCENLKRDLVAKSLLSVDVNGVIASLSKKPSASEASSLIDLLEKQISLPAYKMKNEELLIVEVLGVGSFSQIRSLVRSYITTLLNIGYSSKYLQTVTTRHFFSSTDRIADNSAIVDYIKIFSGNACSYKVAYKVPEYLKDFTDAAKYLKIDIYEHDHDDIPEVFKKPKFDLNRVHALVVFDDVKALDPYSAKSFADKQLNLLQTLIGLYHHKEGPRLNFDCLVCDVNTGFSVKSNKVLHPMHKCLDMKRGPASKKLRDFMVSFSMKIDSFRKFNRSAELHALALSSDSVENQMINLWIALESLMPEKNNNDTASICHIIDSVLPFLNIVYIHKLLASFSRDLLRWDSKTTKLLIKSLPGDGIVQKVSSLLVLEKYAPERARLELSLDRFLLLSERYKYLRGVLSDPVSLLKLLDQHKKRVSWQIRRIYRARNLIVHDGVTPRYTNILIENVHDYLDEIFNALMILGSAGKISAIEQGFKLIDLNYNAYYNSLKIKGLKFEEDNLHELLFKYLVK